MIIGTCGFTGTGSSAVSDFLKEFDECEVIDKYEMAISHCPDGLEDLDFQLNVHCSKYTSSVTAIERFRRAMYSYVISSIKNPEKKRRAVNLAEEYLNAISQTTWMGLGGSDFQTYPSAFYRHGIFNKFIYRAVRSLKERISAITKRQMKGYPIHEMRFSICPDDFDEVTQLFVDNLIHILSDKESNKIVIDQAFSASNPSIGFKYFRDPHAIIVDRDPRDLFLLIKCFYRIHGTGYQVPVNNVADFVEYYRKMHYQNTDCRERILKVQFEDLIYNYEQATDKICEFCGLDKSKHHKFKYLDPKISIANTQLARRYPVESENIRYIEKELSAFLYDFDKYGVVDTSGKMFINQSPLNT